jgi:hypothetical protein
MPEELPIACSLSAGEFPARMAQMAALGRSALADARVDHTHARLRFTAGAGVRDRVERFAADERRCCPFLRFQVRAAPGEVLLLIDAPADAEPVVAELVAAFEFERRAA